MNKSEIRNIVKQVLQATANVEELLHQVRKTKSTNLFYIAENIKSLAINDAIQDILEPMNLDLKSLCAVSQSLHKNWEAKSGEFNINYSTYGLIFPIMDKLVEQKSQGWIKPDSKIGKFLTDILCTLSSALEIFSSQERPPEIAAPILKSDLGVAPAKS